MGARDCEDDDQRSEALRRVLAAADEEERRSGSSSGGGSGGDSVAAHRPALTPSSPQPQPESVLKGSLAQLPILRLDGTRVTSCELQPKLVALYFSGHWCPPCRRFTPLLKSFYEEVYTNGLDMSVDLEPDMGLEVVFVSSDHTAEEMMAYMREAHGPWLRLDYREREAQQALCARFEVRTIPALVVVTWPEGEVLSRNGRVEVAELEPAQCLQTWTDSKRRADCKREALRRQAALLENPLTNR